MTEGDQYRVGEVKFEGMTVFKRGVRRARSSSCRPGDVYKESQHQEGLRQAARRLRQPRATSSGRRSTERKPDPRAQGRGRRPSRMDEDKRYYVGQITLHRQRHHPRQGDPARGLPERGRRLQHRGAQALDPAHQPARLLQADGGRARARARAAAARTSSTSPSRSRSRTATSSRSAAASRAWRARSSTRPSRPRTSWAWARPSRSRPRAAGARRTTRSRSPSPTSSTGPSPPGIDVFKRAASRTRRFDNVHRATRRTGTGRSFTDRASRSGASRACSSNYAYEVVDIEGLDEPGRRPGRPADRPASPIFDPFFFGAERTRRESRITPSLVYNTVDNPWTPRARQEAHRARSRSPAGRWAARVNYFRPDAGGGLVHPAPEADGPGPARARSAYIEPVRRHAQLLPVLPALLPGRRDADPRRTTSARWARCDRSNRALGGNKFVLFNAEYYIDIVGPAALPALLRRRPGLPGGREHRPQGAPHLDGRRAALHHARAERAVPPDLRLEPQPRPVPAEVDLQVRRRHHVLARSQPRRRRHDDEDVMRRSPTSLLRWPPSPCWRQAPCPRRAGRARPPRRRAPRTPAHRRDRHEPRLGREPARQELRGADRGAARTRSTPRAPRSRPSCRSWTRPSRRCRTSSRSRAACSRRRPRTRSARRS